MGSFALWWSVKVSQEPACAAKVQSVLLSLFSQKSLDAYAKNDSLHRNKRQQRVIWNKRQQRVMCDTFISFSPNKNYILFTAPRQADPRM